MTGPYRASQLLRFALAALLCATPVYAQIDSSGSDFIFGFLNNTADNRIPTIELHVTSSVNMQIQVEYPVGTNLGPPVNIVAGNVSIVALPATTSTGWPAGTVASHAVRVHSVNPAQQFTTYLINRAPATSDAALGLPVDSLGTAYRMMSAVPTLGGGTTFGSQFVVVATQDGTNVTITPSQNLSSGQLANVPFSVSLNRGQGWFAVGAGNGAGGDLSGSLVQSTLPVSVTNGVGCVNIDVGACDHVFEVAQAVQTWGTGIPAANLPGFASTGVRYKVMAAEDDTRILQDGVSVGVLNAGQFVTTARLTGGHVFDGEKADSAGTPKPIFVIQLMPGGASGICASGDPAVGNIVPSAQYKSSYTFSTVGGGQFACNFVTIVAQNSDVGTLTLDGVAIPPASFTAIGTSGFSSAIVPVSSGVHSTSSTGTHGITVEGYNSFDSYLYPGGAALDPINVDLKLTKKAQGDANACVAVGAQITYNVCYQNTGDDPANNVVITDTLPAELAFVSATGGGTFSAGTVTWTVASAPANMAAPVCFNLTVNVNNTAVPGGTVQNTASIDSDESDPINVTAETPICTNQPPTAVCQNVTVNTNPGVCTAASASVNNGSFDPDPDDSITLNQTPAGPYGLGFTPVTLTVTDLQGASDSCTATVNVIDGEQPSIACPAPQVIECSANSGASAIIGAPTTADNCSVASAGCTASSGLFPLGETAYSCTVTDGSSNQSSCTSSVKVVDTTKPTLSCVQSYNPSTKNVPKANNQDGFYLITAGDSCTTPAITIGSYTLAAGETIKITQTPGSSGVTLVNTMGPGEVKHFQVGPDDAVITATDGSGNTASVTCLVPPPPQ